MASTHNFYSLSSYLTSKIGLLNHGGRQPTFPIPGPPERIVTHGLPAYLSNNQSKAAFASGLEILSVCREINAEATAILQSLLEKLRELPLQIVPAPRAFRGMALHSVFMPMVDPLSQALPMLFHLSNEGCAGPRKLKHYCRYRSQQKDRVNVEVATTEDAGDGEVPSYKDAPAVLEPINFLQARFRMSDRPLRNSDKSQSSKKRCITVSFRLAFLDCTRSWKR
jgi:hypothetical protein